MHTKGLLSNLLKHLSSGRGQETQACVLLGKNGKNEEVLRHSDATLGLALRAAVAVSGYGCLICVGKCEQQELQEKVMQLYRLCSSFFHGRNRGR